MALNFEAAQAMVGEAIINQSFARLVTHHRGRALRALESAPCVPVGVKLTDEDRLLLGSVRAGSVQEFARGVERLCGDTRPVPSLAPAPAGQDDLSPLSAATEAAAMPRPARVAHHGYGSHRGGLTGRAPLGAG